MEPLPLPPDERMTRVIHAVSTSATPAPVSSFTVPARRGFWARVLPVALAFLVGGLAGGFVVHMVYLRAAGGGGEFTVSSVRMDRTHVRRKARPPEEKTVLKKETRRPSSRQKPRNTASRPWLSN
jgi:hypothetical protein